MEYSIGENNIDLQIISLKFESSWHLPLKSPLIIVKTIACIKQIKSKKVFLFKEALMHFFLL